MVKVEAEISSKLNETEVRKGAVLGTNSLRCSCGKIVVLQEEQEDRVVQDSILPSCSSISTLSNHRDEIGEVRAFGRRCAECLLKKELLRSSDDFDIHPPSEISVGKRDPPPHPSSVTTLNEGDINKRFAEYSDADVHAKGNIAIMNLSNDDTTKSNSGDTPLTSNNTQESMRSVVPPDHPTTPFGMSDDLLANLTADSSSDDMRLVAELGIQTRSTITSSDSVTKPGIHVTASMEEILSVSSVSSNQDLDKRDADELQILETKGSKIDQSEPDTPSAGTKSNQNYQSTMYEYCLLETRMRTESFVASIDSDDRLAELDDEVPSDENSQDSARSSEPSPENFMEVLSNEKDQKSASKEDTELQVRSDSLGENENDTSSRATETHFQEKAAKKDHLDIGIEVHDETFAAEAYTKCGDSVQICEDTLLDSHSTIDVATQENQPYLVDLLISDSIALSSQEWDQCLLNPFEFVWERV